MSIIGIMGGTFNPIHNGHIKIAQAAYEQFHLDEVWFMPNHLPAYKNNYDIISGELRLEMVSLAIKDIPYFKASDFEIKKKGKTYTYKTMEELALQYPQHSFCFIMGADSLMTFDKWMHPEIILQYADILVAVRDNQGISEIKTQISYLSNLYKKDVFHLILSDKISCSSSNIRKKFRENDISHSISANTLMISQDVYKFIKDRKLYMH